MLQTMTWKSSTRPNSYLTLRGSKVHPSDKTTVNLLRRLRHRVDVVRIASEQIGNKDTFPRHWFIARLLLLFFFLSQSSANRPEIVIALSSMLFVPIYIIFLKRKVYLSKYLNNITRRNKFSKAKDVRKAKDKFHIRLIDPIKLEDSKIW